MTNCLVDRVGSAGPVHTPKREMVVETKHKFWIVETFDKVVICGVIFSPKNKKVNLENTTCKIR